MAYPRLPVVSAVLVLLPAVAATGQVQSKLAGSWTLVEGVQEFAGEKQPLTYDGEVYLVIRPDGSFYKVGHFANSALDRLKSVGDRFVTAKNAQVEVLGSKYETDVSKLRMSFHDGSGGDPYEFRFDARLQVDGKIIFKSVTPMMGHVPQTVTATLERVDREPLWQPDGMIAEWSLDSSSLSVDVSADGTRIVASDHLSGVVSLWNIDDTDQDGKKFAGHENEVCVVTISSDGKLIASGSRRHSRRGGEPYPLRIWDVQSGKELHHIDVFHTITSIDFAPDGNTLFASGIPLNYSIDSKMVAGRWNVQTGELESSIYGDHAFLDAVWSPDGRTILVQPKYNRDNARLLIVDATTGDEVLRLTSRLQPIQDMTFSSDGARILTASETSLIREWKIATGEELRRFKVDPLWASEVVCLPGGGQILTANASDNSICLWDTETSKLIKKFAGHRDSIVDLKVSSDGSIAVSTSLDGTVRAWRLSPAVPLQPFAMASCGNGGSWPVER